MRSSTQGFSLIELIIVAVIMGILIAIGFVQLNPNGTATRQAAEVIAAAVNQARFEAVRTSNTSGFMISPGSSGTSGTVTVCRNVDESIALTCGSGEIAETIDFSNADLARAQITSGTMTVFFDRRGIVRNPGAHVVTVADRSGGNIRTVTILPTGRAEVN